MCPALNEAGLSASLFFFDKQMKKYSSAGGIFSTLFFFYKGLVFLNPVCKGCVKFSKTLNNLAAPHKIVREFHTPLNSLVQLVLFVTQNLKSISDPLKKLAY